MHKQVKAVVLLGALCFGFVSTRPSTWDINAPGCGKHLVNYTYPDNYVVGGEEAFPHAYPWIVAMYLHGSFKCAGSYVKGVNGYSYILTAAHCTVGTYPSDWEIHFGRHDLSVSEPFFQHIVVAQIINHPLFEKGIYNWDVALMRLMFNPRENVYVEPVCISPGEMVSPEIAFVTRWGSLHEEGTLRDKLHVVSKLIESHRKCTDLLGSNNYDDSNMLCSGYSADDANSCQGDSGGPLMALSGSRPELIGVVSWGLGCGVAMGPGVYHNILKSKTWINSYINRAIHYDFQE